MAIVAPSYEGCKDMPENYRPVSLQSVVTKLLRETGLMCILKGKN